MNKKFLVVALMAALSTVATATIEDKVNANKVAIETINGTVNELQDKVQEFDKNFATKGELKAEVDKIDTENSIQNDRLSQAESKLDKKADYSDLAAVEADKNAIKEQVDKNKAEFEQFKGTSEAVDTALAGKIEKNDQAIKENASAIEANKNQIEQNRQDIAKGDQINKVQNQQIGALQTENVEQNNRLDKVEKENGKQNAAIEANKNQIEQNRQDIAKGDQINKVQNQQIGALQTENVEQNNRLDKVEKENDKQNGRLDKVEGKNKEQDKTIAQNKQDIADLRNDYTQVNGRLSGLEKKVDNLDNKMNKGLSLMAAMNAVDFQNVQTGEMAIGAGVGHYGNAQSVALGVAYSPVEDLTVNAKYSVTAGDVDSFALGAGATYKFKVGR